MNRQILVLTTSILFLGLSTALPALAAPLWFDETGGGAGYPSFAALAEGYGKFTSHADSVISFDDLKVGATLSNQYLGAFGVSFANTAVGRYSAYSTIQNEGGGIAEDITGYDGSYMPNGNNVVVKFDNNMSGSPFTIVFDDPVSSVGAFVGMGVQGNVHTLQISLYNPQNHLLDRKNVQSWLWEKEASGQNYESFFAVTLSDALISRVEILNLATQDFANALLLDNLGWGRAENSMSIPEPTMVILWLLSLGGLKMLGHKRFNRAMR